MARKTAVTLISLLFLITLFANERVLIRIPNADAALLQKYQSMDADIAAFHDGEYLDLVWPVENLEQLRAQHPALSIRSTEAEIKANLSSRDIPGYRNYQQMLDEIYMIQALHPSLVQIEVIGAGWGKDYAQQGLPAYQDFDHDIHAIKVSSNVSQIEDEPAFYFVGEHHAREPISMEVCVAILQHLVDGYGFDPQITGILDSSQVWIVPLLNPDGHKIVIDQTDIWWRKNIRDNNDNGSIDMVSLGNGFDGVDLNRNYGHMWGNISASDDPYSALYHGPNPFSEPETIAFKALLEAHPFVAGISYHTYGEYVLYPYGYAHYLNAPDCDELSALAIAMASSIPRQATGTYLAMPSFALYPVSGSLDDWAYGALGIFPYTIEMASQFIPPAAQVPGIVQNHLTAAKTLLTRKDSKTLCGHITDATTGAPLRAMIFVDGIDDHYLPRATYYSSSTFGSYWRFLPAGTHHVRYVADGYLAQNYNLEITETGQTVCDVALQAAPTISQSFRITDDIGGPIADAILTTDGNTFHSDAAGNILLENIPAGDYQLRISAVGYTSINRITSLLGSDLEFTLTANPIFMDGFEQGIANWVTSGTWGISNQAAYSGTMSLSNSPAGSFARDMYSDCHTVQAIDLSGYEQVNLQFVAQLTTANDGGYFSVGYQLPGSDMVNTIELIRGNPDWTHFDLDLSFLAGQSITLYFTFRSVGNHTADVIYIDDVWLFGSSSYLPADDPVAPPLALSYGPNPFVHELKIDLGKQNMQDFSIEIYNLRGQKVIGFSKKSLTSDASSVIWNGRDFRGREVASGIYFLRLKTADGRTASRKILKIK